MGKVRDMVQREQCLANDPEMRRKIFEELLEHVSEGFSVESFSKVSDVTVRKYLKMYPEFDEELLDAAKRLGRQVWEGIGKKQATGECLGNSRSWVYNMINRYGWSEKVQIDANHTGQVAVNVVSYRSTQPEGDKAP